jgi:hypothetical protein
MHPNFVLYGLFVIASTLWGCARDQAAHNPVLMGKESGEQSKLKARLSQMTPAEVQEELKNNPKERALMMPQGMGNPGARFAH